MPTAYNPSNAEWMRPVESLTSDGVRELQRLKAENAKLRRAFNETLIRLVAANDVTVSNYMDDEYLELLRELGIEVE